MRGHFPPKLGPSAVCDAVPLLVLGCRMLYTEKPQQEGVTVDPKALSGGLTAAVKKLQKALDDVRREEREGQLTRKKRDEVAAVCSGRYQGVADITTGIYELCGRVELADLVRPTARRRAGMTEAEDQNPGGSAPGDAASPAAPE